MYTRRLPSVKRTGPSAKATKARTVSSAQQTARVNVDDGVWADFRVAAIRSARSVADYLGDLVRTEVKRSQEANSRRETVTKSPPTLDEVRSRRNDIARIAGQHGASNIRIFGSVARGDAVPESDIDLLVDLNEPAPKGLAYFGLIDQLERKLGELLDRPIHVAQAAGGSSQTADRIRREAVSL